MFVFTEAIYSWHVVEAVYTSEKSLRGSLNILNQCGFYMRDGLSPHHFAVMISFQTSSAATGSLYYVSNLLTELAWVHTFLESCDILQDASKTHKWERHVVECARKCLLHPFVKGV